MKEVEKIVAAQERSRTLSEFLDWLSENEYSICRFEEHIRYSEEPGDFTPEGWYPRRKSNEQLLADFFEIDLDKVEEERRQILGNLRNEMVEGQ